MYQRNGAGLNWATLFMIEGKKSDLIKQINSALTRYDWDKYDFHFLSIEEVSQYDSAYKQACKNAALKFCIEDTSFAKDLLSEQDYEKCLSLIDRKQYNSKILTNLLNKFCYFLSCVVPEHAKLLENLLKLDVIRQTNEIREKETEKNFQTLKKHIEKIASGVKGICYLATEKPLSYNIYLAFENLLSDELNNYLKENFSYDYNRLHSHGSLNLLVLFDHREKQVNELLQRALLDDSEFWAKHKDFSIITFIKLIYKHNDQRHAEKVLNYIFTQIKKDELGKTIIDNALPLNFLNRNGFIDGLEERTFSFAFDRFRDEYDLQPILNSELCYPFISVENSDDRLLKGKALTEELFGMIYPNEYENVLNFINAEIENPSPVFDEEQSWHDVIDKTRDIQIAVQSTNRWTIKSIFDSHTFGYHINIIDRKAVEVLCPKYFDAKNIWNRFYLKSYYMFEITKDKKACFANLFEIFYDLFQFIEKRLGIRTSFQRNTEGRDTAFEILKTILAPRDVHASDNFKEEYVISLLDRKVAIREESEKFPVLEQLGDAIYGFAVAELLFYNPTAENISQSYDDFINANTQILVAKKIGTDKLYLSAHSLPKKYETDILIDADTETYVFVQEREQLANKHKYIADSLEMIIGTICRDCGYEKAISFSKSILKETFPEKFNEELHWGDTLDLSIDRDYWTRILPSPYSSFENDQRMLWIAFDKFYKTYILGTENVATRQYITYSFGDNKLYDDCGSYYEVNKVFYEYLHKGLKNAIDKYGDSVKEKYQKLNK